MSRRGGARGQPNGSGSEDVISRRITDDLEGEERRETMLICESWLEIDRVCSRTDCRYKHPKLCYGTCNNRNCDGLHRAEAKKILIDVRRERDRVRKFKHEAYKNKHCMKYLRGFCVEGSRCRWIHPRLEVAPWNREQGDSAEISGEDDGGERNSELEGDGILQEVNDSYINEERSEVDGVETMEQAAASPVTEDEVSESDILNFLQKTREDMENSKR